MRPLRAAAAVLLLTLAAIAAGAGAQEPEPPPDEAVYREEISVDLLTVTVRVVDGSGEPLLGLGPADFIVRHRRRTLPVVAVDWVAAAGGEAAELEPAAAETEAPASAPTTFSVAPGRVVFWVQPDVHGVRIRGHLKFLPYLRRLLDKLPSGGQMAVLSFDSHLKLWQDFTRSRELVEFALEDAIYFGKRAPAISGLPGGLGRHLEPRAAKRAATPEVALRLTAEALAELPGEKSLIMVGWGLGRYGSSGFQMTGDYSKALAALDRARATVFVLDITDADFHTLELGLRQVARNTGGGYFKTVRFPSQAVNRLARTLGGHYRLTVDISGEPAAQERTVKIRLAAKRGRVLAGTR